MPGPTEHLQAYLIVDNCFLVMLTECFCERYASRYPQNHVIGCAEQWIADVFAIVKNFAVDGNLYCTQCVAGEYNPQAGRMGQRQGIQRKELNHLQGCVRAHLSQSVEDLPPARALRNLPAAPRQLIGVGGLSDNDLSLVQLGLELTRVGSPVFILSNDQSLLDFITWIRAQKNRFSNPIVTGLLQGWRCLTYLELIHRSCNITSDVMKELINFALVDHYNRTDIAGSQKGNSIFQQLISVHENFNQSIVIKKQVKAAAA